MKKSTILMIVGLASTIVASVIEDAQNREALEEIVNEKLGLVDKSDEEDDED